MRKATRSPGAAAVLCLLVLSCSSTPKKAEPTVLSNTSTKAGNTVISDEMIGRRRGEMKLSQIATNPEYGYSEQTPVKVGGGFGSGSDRTYKYLNALRGPGGEAITYSRVGTCCPFKSANSPFGDEALLEVYVVNVPDVTSPKRLYFDWYDDGEILVPVGLSAAP